jgi:hypothetical protein
MILRRKCIRGIPTSRREQQIRNDVKEKEGYG